MQHGDSPLVIRCATHTGTVPLPQHLQNGHVLNEDGVNTGIRQFGKQLTGCFQLIVVYDGVDGDIDLRRKLMGVKTELADVVDGIACRHAGTEARRADIDGVGTMIDGCQATLQILGGRQQFK